MKKLEDVSRQVDFAKEEDSVLEYWKKIDAFKTSLKKSEGRPPYSFYDGPPFATGLPHYGHILAGTIKDIVTRYAHQTGHHVERRFGWDCHGLPIEFAIEKEIGLKTKEDVLKYGIKNYNAACRNIVTRYCKEWEIIVTRLGRWIDFKNDYKTMDLSFMESVWWVFGQLFKKNLVYKGFKVMPYSTACTTPLSNFEVQQNYKEVYDPSIVITFPLVEDENTKLIAWTTTPWTLPSNLACCVNDNMTYVKIQPAGKDEHWILAKCRLDFLFPKKKGKKKKGGPAPYKILEEFPGSNLVGKEYKPLFNYFVGSFEKDKVFHVVSDDYVTDESGTGIVHQAPAFGEDDFRICMKYKIIKKGGEIACPVDDNGRFLDPVVDFKGKHVKEADDFIVERLKKDGRLIRKESVKHSYPFCWRSDTPLIYKAVPSWFVRVEEVKEDLLKNNSETYWVPNFVKEKRFHNWLENARDWAISRTRYWGCPIPIWTSKDGEEVVCVSSVKELEELSGRTGLTDIHREHIDDITIPSKMGKEPLRRIEDVFDCWFESGSMPYAQAHYPFENKEKFEASFPADFIAEGLDQTRGWFYTLMVLGTCLFNKPPFKNLVVNGLVLASDGKKMSKRLKNYKDPMLVVNQYGADALRLYLINSPVVRAEPLKFEVGGVQRILQSIFLPWYNAYRFFIQNMKRYCRKHDGGFGHREAHSHKLTNLMDQWILSCSQTLVKFCREEMAAYRLYTVVPALIKFVEELTNWYVRLNRPRMKGEMGKEEWKCALMTMYRVLRIAVLTLSPFCPFLAEKMYQNLKHFEEQDEEEEVEGEDASVPKKESEVEKSVHFLLFPEFDEKLVRPDIEDAVQRMQKIVVSVRRARDLRKLAIKQPLQEVKVVSLKESELKGLEDLTMYMKQEMNVKEVTFGTNVTDYFKFKAITNDRVLGKRLRKKMREVKLALKNVKDEDVVKFIETGSLTICGEKLEGDDCKFNSEFTGDSQKFAHESVTSVTMALLDCELTKDLELEGWTRNLLSSVQQGRKKAGLVVEDNVDVYIKFLDDKVEEMEVINSEKHKEMLLEMMKPHMTLTIVTNDMKGKDVFYQQNVPDVEEMEVKFYKKRQERIDKLTKEIPQLTLDLENLKAPQSPKKSEAAKKHQKMSKKQKGPSKAKLRQLKQKQEDLAKKIKLAEEALKKAHESKFVKPNVKYVIYFVRK